MSLDSGSLEGIGDLEVGKKVSAWYRQWHSEWGRNTWEYKIKVTDKKDVETKNFGTQTVYVIEESRYSPEWSYSSEMTLHYSPALSNTTYWKYVDKDGSEECELVAIK